MEEQKEDRDSTECLFFPSCVLFNPLLASWKMCWKLSLCLKYSWTNARDTVAHFCQETLLPAARYFALRMKNEQLMYRWNFSIASIGAVKNISKVLYACINQGTWLSCLGERVTALKTDCFCPGFKLPQILQDSKNSFRVFC